MPNPSDPSSDLPALRKLSPSEAYAASRAREAVLVDVREAPLYENAHIDPSVSLPLAQIEALGGRVPGSLAGANDALLILYCA